MTAINTLREGWRLRRVWWFTATARTKARFSRTLLGSFWLGLSNLLSIGVLGVVYGTVFKVKDFNTYIVYLGLGLVVWNSLSSAISSAPNLFEQNAGHIHNTNINPIFYPLEEWAFQLQTFFQSLFLVLIGLSPFKHDLLLNFFLYAWLPLFNLILAFLWLPLLICLVGARYRDFYQLVPIMLQLVFLLSPILYVKDALGSMGWTADINPLYLVLSSFRSAIIAGHPHIANEIYMTIFNIVALLFVAWLLNREKPHIPFLI